MINYETIKSVYEDKLTLMQWLVKVQKALKDATAVSFNVNKTGDATLTFSILFDDGTELETAPIILEQGESVESATLRNGHLILTLTNGDELDAGNMGAVSGFFINDAQHLIVQYQDGTTNDLGAIFNGSISINGNISATGNISASGTISGKTPVLTADEDEITAQKPVVEVMNGYNITEVPQSNLTLSYVGVCKNGNKLTIAFSGKATKGANFLTPIFYLEIPAAVNAKLVPNIDDYLVEDELYLISNQFNLGTKVPVTVRKVSTVELLFTVNSLDGVADSTDYYFRHEVTFLLSENLVE